MGPRDRVSSQDPRIRHDEGRQQAELMWTKRGRSLDWGGSSKGLLFTIASGVLLVAFSAAFTGIYYLFFELGKSKAHLKLVHVIAGSVTAGFVATAVVVIAVLVVRRVRAERDLQRQISEARTRQRGVGR